MQTGWLLTLVATGASVAGYVVKKLIDYLLGRRPLRIDEATKIRTELRGEIERKDKQLADLGNRLTGLEEELEKAERERDDKILVLERYKLDVYRSLVNYGADRELVDIVIAIKER